MLYFEHMLSKHEHYLRGCCCWLSCVDEISSSSSSSSSSSLLHVLSSTSSPKTQLTGNLSSLNVSLQAELSQLLQEFLESFHDDDDDDDDDDNDDDDDKDDDDDVSLCGNNSGVAIANRGPVVCHMIT